MMGRVLMKGRPMSGGPDAAHMASMSITTGQH